MKTPIKEEVLSTNKTAKKKELSLWKVYWICLAISAIFFFLFGFNSPIYKFNVDHDYQWFMTMGNGLVHGKIPYRDLFEQKGPIVYFVTAFCCLFPTPRLMMLIIEIFSMSLFFLFSYKICNKYLSTSLSLFAIPVLALAIFSSWVNIRNGSTVEEFTLPIYSYFLLCWIEFIAEKKEWNNLRALYLGLCFGIILWVKYTLIFSMLIPMLFWFFLCLYRHQHASLIKNTFYFTVGILIISAPILLFYALHHAINELFYVYFYINLTAYGTTDSEVALQSFKLFFNIGPIILTLLIFTTITFVIKSYRRKDYNWILLVSLLISFLILVYASKCIFYNYSQLFPYIIFGITDILQLFSKKTIKHIYAKLFFISITVSSIIICCIFPLSMIAKEINRAKNEYAPLLVAEILRNYEEEKNLKPSLFCYKLMDYGFYNAANIIPDHYFYANNAFDESRFSEMYKQFKESIIHQTTDFVITEFHIWQNENEFISEYYKPYTNDILTSTFYYEKAHCNIFWNFHLILLVRK